uniref:Protein kinase domain-containing protein n=1 Tax=Parascaris equorum TaxID=6256 RepID=A0A914RF43_PAREQ
MSFDTKNFHQIRVESRAGTSVFTVPKRYTNLSFISAGAQGTVVRADDLVTNEPVAIKKVQHPFLTPMNAKRTYREFVLLVTMQHPNVSSVYFLRPYVLMIVAMKYMHRSGIIHRDLKPSNIVVNDKCILKILDFGLARKMETNERMSIYVVTRHYRAPEVILGLPDWLLPSVDIWAIGCILAEMILRRILFPGTDRLDQWTKITSVLGTPSKEFIDRLAFCFVCLFFFSPTSNELVSKRKFGQSVFQPFIIVPISQPEIIAKYAEVPANAAAGSETPAGI